MSDNKLSDPRVKKLVRDLKLLHTLKQNNAPTVYTNKDSLDHVLRILEDLLITALEVLGVPVTSLAAKQIAAPPAPEPFNAPASFPAMNNQPEPPASSRATEVMITPSGIKVQRPGAPAITRPPGSILSMEDLEVGPSEGAETEDSNTPL